MTIGKRNLTKQPFDARIKVSIVQFFFRWIVLSYYALLDLKKVVISACFNVMIYIEFELFNY